MLRSGQISAVQVGEDLAKSDAAVPSDSVAYSLDCLVIIAIPD
jgi:hypothetical protein